MGPLSPLFLLSLWPLLLQLATLVLLLAEGASACMRGRPQERSSSATRDEGGGAAGKEAETEVRRGGKVEETAAKGTSGGGATVARVARLLPCLHRGVHR